MKIDSIQNKLIDKIHKRLDRLTNSNYVDYANELKMFVDFLYANSITNGLISFLDLSSSEYQKEIDNSPNIIFKPNNDFERYYKSYALIKKCLSHNQNYPQWRIVEKINNKLAPHETIEATKYFNLNFVFSLVEYLEDNLNEKNIILSLLKKYKHRCEWFRSEQLLSKYDNNTQRGEKLLVLDLYEYLFDNDVEFYIEPSSISGEIDIISAQSSHSPLLADAKIFDPKSSKDRNYIASGFRQIYSYTQNYNQPVGYLVIYKTCEEDLRLSLTDVLNNFPYIIYNHKVIFFVVIDLFLYSKPASKRGKIKCYEINEEFLISFVKEN